MSNIKRFSWGIASSLGYYSRLHRLFSDESNAVLMYHSVGRPDRFGNVSVDRLRSDVRYLRENYEVVDLPGVLDSDKGKKVALTFDDGWDDFYENAVPVLEEQNVPATVFVVSKYLNSDMMMSTEEVVDLSENCEQVTVGNHTMSHPKLSRIGDIEELERQIVDAKHDLEETLDIEVDRFCYPSGDFDDRVVDVVRDSHGIAVSTTPRVLDRDRLRSGEYDRYTLPRVAAHNSKARVRWEMSDTGSRIREQAKSQGLASR